MSEGSRVAETIRVDEIPCVTGKDINTDTFIAVLRIGLPEAIEQIPGRHPVVPRTTPHGSGSDEATARVRRASSRSQTVGRARRPTPALAETGS